MSDYIPTTEIVRAEFAKCRGCYRCESDGDGDERTNHKAEFDRWLASVKSAERERVVALLEAETDKPPFYTKTFLIEHFIALIKGEAVTE